MVPEKYRNLDGIDRPSVDGCRDKRIRIALSTFPPSHTLLFHLTVCSIKPSKILRNGEPNR